MNGPREKRKNAGRSPFFFEDFLKFQLPDASGVSSPAVDWKVPAPPPTFPESVLWGH